MFDPSGTTLPISAQATLLHDIAQLDSALTAQFQSRMTLHPQLSRSLVSFQANKSRPVYRWYKYKEAFSAALVEYLLRHYALDEGKLLDPFAGSGTALFVAAAQGLDAEGIELLPIGQQLIQTKVLLETAFAPADFARLRVWATEKPWEHIDARLPLPELRITRGAYPLKTRDAIEHYMGALTQEAPHVQAVLRFALLCVLESVSYTRKDGQYLRWDYRSGRKQGKKRFDKGEILDFVPAISAKILEIVVDVTAPPAQLDLFAAPPCAGSVVLHHGSCLNLLPTLPEAAYNVIITSPPYCNRYDYTRTYALELALLGVDEAGLRALRQTLLSATVENRAKDLLGIHAGWGEAIQIADEQPLLQTILRYLENLKQTGELNNAGIPRMVRGYFYEMACVIAECARVLQPGVPLFMVNDNVRYAGASISVDLILSSFAERLGFTVENILVLPNGKGNSSQQMGKHGRDPLRKCVYVWRKR